MRDLQTWRVVDAKRNKLFECKDSKSDGGRSLLVHVAATHAGIINGNMRFYRPDKMQEGAHTWLPEFTKDGTCLRTPRPVLVGHDEKGDVLGRVLEAKYIDTSWKYAADFPIVKDFLFYQHDGRKRHNLFDTVDWVVENLMPLDEYTGLGYTDLGLRITNPEAIRKVLADEYLTVSVGFKTDSALCSICHTDWAADGKCEHKLGQKVDGRQMFLISGAIVNEELSFINFAADPFATTLSKKVLTDSLEQIFFLGLSLDAQRGIETAGISMKDGLYESDLIATEDPMLKVNDATLDVIKIQDEIKSADLTKEKAMDLRASLSAWSPEEENLQSEKRALVSTLNAKITKNNWDQAPDIDAAVAAELAEFVSPVDAKKCPDCGKPEKECTCEKDADGKKKEKKDPDDDDDDGDVEPAPNGMSGKKISKKSAKKTKAFQNKEINSVEGDECSADGSDCNWEGWEDSAPEADKEYFADVDGINQEIEDELDAAVADGELPAEIVADAKLSTEKRNKLSKGTFCGPGRSFPVPDCAHVVAARRLIGRASVSSDTKAKILACVSRKAKTLNCGTAKKKDEVSSLPEDTKRIARATVLIDSMMKQADDAKLKEGISEEEREELVNLVVTLDKAYDKLSEKRDSAGYQLRWLIRAMLMDWDADDEMRWAIRALAGKDQVVLSKAEVDEKNNAVNSLTAEKETLSTKISGLMDSRQAVLNAGKVTLAQQIVMHGVLTGQDAYKGLTPSQLSDKINDLAKRTLISLRDTVQDILDGLQWVKKTDSTSTAVESLKKMDDNARVTESVDSHVITITDSQRELEAAQAAQNLQTKLRYMTAKEKSRFLAGFEYQSLAATK